MESQSGSTAETSEQTLLSIVRKLPPERVTQVIDFARFLEEQTVKADPPEMSDETEDEIAAEEARWDTLLASDESQRLLEKMADEALAEIRAGHARPMSFTEDGELAPG